MINFTERLELAKGDESGFTTAELLGNAAIGVVAIVIIWAALRAVGINIIAKFSDLLVTNNNPPNP